MKVRALALTGVVVLSLCGCKKQAGKDDVVSQRYIHKYGYAVSQEEWDAKHYPGQVITHLASGVVITATYENGMLQGPTTRTFPGSQIVQQYSQYNQGAKVKEIFYDSSGMPLQEKITLSPNRYTLTVWYADGVPMSIEDYAGEELLEGQYYTLSNEIEARVEKGKGARVIRDGKGLLLAKEEIAEGMTTKKETFFPSGAPESIAYYQRGQLHGEKKTFSTVGEPLVTEEWIGGKLHGKCTYYKNGVKYLEISYLNGEKNGLETHFVDGMEISQQLCWENDKKHGAETYYIDGAPKTTWYYSGSEVSQGRFEELNRLDLMISQGSFHTPSKNN